MELKLISTLHQKQCKGFSFVFNPVQTLNFVSYFISFIVVVQFVSQILTVNIYQSNLLLKHLILNNLNVEKVRLNIPLFY